MRRSVEPAPDHADDGVNAHEAAVRAVAAGLCGAPNGANCTAHRREAERAIAALATDPDVRAALNRAVDEAIATAVCKQKCLYPHLHGSHITSTAILAALAPPEAP